MKWFCFDFGVRFFDKPGHAQYWIAFELSNAAIFVFLDISDTIQNGWYLKYIHENSFENQKYNSKAFQILDYICIVLLLFSKYFKCIQILDCKWIALEMYLVCKTIRKGSPENHYFQPYLNEK